MSDVDAVNEIYIEFEKERALRIQAECRIEEILVASERIFREITQNRIDIDFEFITNELRRIRSPSVDGTAVGKVLEAAKALEPIKTDHGWAIRNVGDGAFKLAEALSQLEGGGK